MQAKLKTHEDDFKPVKLEIIIETRKELTILNHLFNTDASKLTDIVNYGINNASWHNIEDVKQATDPIYLALNS